MAILLVSTLLIAALSAAVAYFFIRPRRALFRRAADARKTLFSEADTRVYEFRGTHIHYRQTGQGPDLVLIHGIGASLFTWTDVIEPLSHHFRVTALDLPGFGFSRISAPTVPYDLDQISDFVHGFLGETGVTHAILVGSSMGGSIALWMSRQYPSHYDQLVLLSPAVNGERYNRILLPPFIPFQFLRYFASERVFRLILSRILSRQDRITPERTFQYLLPYLDDGRSVMMFYQALSVVRDARLPEELKLIKARVLLLWGAKDLIIPVGDVQLFKKYLPHVEVKIHPEAGHHIMEDEPEWTIEQIKGFFHDRLNGIG